VSPHPASGSPQRATPNPPGTRESTIGSPGEEVAGPGDLPADRTDSGPAAAGINARSAASGSSSPAAAAAQAETSAAHDAQPLEVSTISPDELTPGQRGYGLSVFTGSQPERFEAEVVGVLRNLAPDTSYILARLSGKGLEESGVAAGMSGSPVYFDGRLAGAVAFSWPFSHDAIAGITPIGSMRQIPVAPGAPPGGVPVQPAGAVAARALGMGAAGGPPVPLADLVAGRVPADLVEREIERLRPRLAGGATAGIQWSLAGFPAATEERLRQWLGPVAPAGAMAGPAEAAGLAPGGSVSAVLVDGDLRLAATGTVTDVAGDSVLAFGHAFLGVGPIRVPMATSEVVTVLSSVMSSFKVANLGPVVGAFEEDRVSGIRGRLGAEAPMIPLTLTVRAPEPRQLRMRLASMPQITPVLIAISSMAGLDAASYANGIQGLDMTVHFRLAGLDDLTVEQSFDGPGAAAQASAYLMGFAGYLLQNDLAEVGLDGVEVELVQSPAPRTATLVGAHAERTVVRPGESIDLNLDFVAWRGAPFRRTVTVDIPDDLPDGR
jgi:hypothetical protein